MPILLRNALALLGGLVIGGAVNMAMITLSPSVIAPPAGVNINSTASLSASMHLFEPRHFLMPFLAHALGTLSGSLTSYLIAATYKVPIAYVVGALFLCGGVAASFMIPAPAWFIALDLVAAYLPMAWAGIQIGTRMTRVNASARKPRGA